MGWTVRGSNPGRSEIFRYRTKSHWDSPNIVYNGYRVNRLALGVYHPPSSSLEVKERIELCSSLPIDLNELLYSEICFYNAGSWTEGLVMEPSVISKSPYQPSCADFSCIVNNKIVILSVNESGN
jgi:hypothetical protein